MSFTLPKPRELKTLTAKIKFSLEVIREAYRRFNASQIGLIWTGGKDSTLVLALTRRADCFPQIIFVDNGNVFPSLVRFSTELARDWEFDFEIVSNELNPDRGIAEELRDYLLNTGIRVLLTGLRKEDGEGGGFFEQGGNPNHVRVCPIFHFTEREVWEAIFRLKVPYCSLYEGGYRTLDRRELSRPAQQGIPAYDQHFGMVKVQRESDSQRKVNFQRKVFAVNAKRIG